MYAEDGARPVTDQQSGLDEPMQLLAQVLAGQVGDPRQQLVGKLAADHRARLRDCLRRPQPVEPRHQRIVKRRRNGKRSMPAHRRRVVGLLHGRTFEHVARQVLDEQRQAVGTVGDLANRRSRDRAIAAQKLDHRHRIRPRERTDRHLMQVILVVPVRVELRSSRADDEHRQRLHAIDQYADQLVGRRIDPVQVLDDDEHGLQRRERFEQPHQRREQLVLLPLRRHVERRVARVAADPHQVGEQRHDVGSVRKAAGQQALDLAKLRGIVVVIGESRGERQLPYQRRQRTALQVRRAVVPKPHAAAVDVAPRERFGEA